VKSMLHDAFVSTSRVRAFVRDVLKCGCPESVFDDVRIGLPSLHGTHRVAGGLEILVGRRLLVAIVPFEDVGDPESDIPKMLKEGRRARDDNGFNRVRLVLVGSFDAAQRARLEAQTAALDDRMHIHLVEERQFVAIGN